MKRTLSLALVFILVLSLALPAFAEETSETYYLSGVWKLGKDIPIPSFTFPSATSEGVWVSNLKFRTISTVDGVKTYSENTYEKFTYYKSGNDYYLGGRGASGHLRLIIWNASKEYEGKYVWALDFGLVAQAVPEDFYNWFTANAESITFTCDGSTCPATDVNQDNVCDDCGATFAVLRNYAPSDWPSILPDVPYVGPHYTILTANEHTYLYMSSEAEPLSIVISDADGNGNRTLTFNLAGPYPTYNLQRYVLVGDQWAYDSVGSLTSFTYDSSLKLVYSSTDILDSSGNIFFPIPLWMEMNQVTQGETQNLMAQTVGTMKILVLCGVGLIACLMALSLFFKVLRIFQL